MRNRTVDSAFLHQYLNKKLKPLGNILLSKYDESQKLIAGFFAILYELSYKKVKQSIKWKYLRTTVVCNWESPRPHLSSKLALFKTSWQFLKVALCCVSSEVQISYFLGMLPAWNPKPKRSLITLVCHYLMRTPI